MGALLQLGITKDARAVIENIHVLWLLRNPIVAFRIGGAGLTPNILDTKFFRFLKQWQRNCRWCNDGNADFLKVVCFQVFQLLDGHETQNLGFFLKPLDLSKTVDLTGWSGVTGSRWSLYHWRTRKPNFDGSFEAPATTKDELARNLFILGNMVNEILEITKPEIKIVVF